MNRTLVRSPQPRAVSSWSGWKRDVATVARRFPQRLRDRRFWITQALVLGISAAHTALEATHHLGVLPDLALLPVSTFFIPVVYAALNFGVEGAVPTALWCTLLSLPNVILWHTGAQRPGVLLQLALLVVLAYVIARRVDFEMAAKERAQAANARLARVNLAAAASARSLDLDSVLSQTVAAMLDPERRQRGWVMLARNGGDAESITSSSTATASSELQARELAFSRSVFAELPTGSSNDGLLDGQVFRDDDVAILPLRVSGQVVGAVGLASQDQQIADDDLKLLQAVSSQLGVALGNIRHFRQTQTMVGELSRAHTELEEYVRLASDAQEEERKRLARELHDDTIQALVVAKAELDALATELPVPETASARLKKVETTLSGAIDSVRRFSRDLRPSLLDDLGLVHAIDWLTGDLAARTGIKAQIRTTGTPRRLDPKDELALFRIVQEALHNVERHSGANTARVRMHFGEDIRISVIDDGRGFDTRQAFDPREPAKRLGLLGMSERAKLAGAQLSIKGRPASGTRVVVTLTPTS
jgi:signal transduction histidine kinase